jgi:hypothetical protein
VRGGALKASLFTSNEFFLSENEEEEKNVLQ